MSAREAEPARGVLWLKRRCERRLLHGHPWVFSNEVDTERAPLGGFEPGAEADVRAHSGRPLGSAYVNPHSLICARLYAPATGVSLSREELARRLREALTLRERLFGRPFYRLVYSESDALPGLVVDRYGDLLAVQINTAGMERRRAEVIEALEALLSPRVIVLRNDTAARALEGLAREEECVRGRLPESLEIEENALRFEVPAQGAQKTGWFYDQGENRGAVARHCAGARVLDLFCYAGGFGVQAGAAGASEVLCVDASGPATALAEQNAARNGLAGRVRAVQGDAFEMLKSLRADGRRFDVVVLDPPAFVRRRKDLEAGQEAYRRLNRLALGVVEPGGLLFSASCSSHLPRERLLALVGAAGRDTGRRLQVIAQAHQRGDHPVHPGLPESDYLKGYLCRVCA